ncbi:hypothetical protein C7S13_8050 [Burkholderia cepacia]|nr:hypothetical protein [Burkholderia cepacia]
MRGGRARANGHAPDARTRARRAGVRDPRLPGVRLADEAAWCPFQLDMERHRCTCLRRGEVLDERRIAGQVRAPVDALVHGRHLRGTDARCDAGAPRGHSRHLWRHA